MEVSKQNPDMTDIHMLALNSGAVYHQEVGQRIGSYTFSVEGLANMLQAIALQAVEHVSELSYLRGAADENMACERICLEPADIAGTKVIVRDFATKIAARRKSA